MVAEKESISNETPSPLVSRRSSLPMRFFAIVRFLVFVGLLLFMAASLLPFGEGGIAVTSLPFIRTLVGIVALIILVAVLFYFFTFQRTPTTIKSTVNLEVMAAVVLGMLAVVVVGVVVMIRSESPPQLIGLGALLVAIYAYYLYRILKDNLRVMRENDEIRRQYGALYEIDRDKSNFIMVTSHQLRTPLTEMKWSLEQLLNKQGLPTSTLKILERYRGSLDALIAIVNEMVSAQPADIARAPLKQERVDVVALVQKVVSGLARSAEHKEVNLALTNSETEQMAKADQEQLQRVLQSIIDNAVRYSPKGSVRVSVQTSGNSVQVRVEDSGIGITTEDYPRVFKRFFRGENAVLVEPNGSGLGLYNAKNIIEQHGGTIDFTSVEGKGSVFTISLPLAN